MGSKFNSLFGSYSKLYDQPTYRPRTVQNFGLDDDDKYGNKDRLGFTSEEGRNSILPCPFGFNYKFMNPREFQRLVYEFIFEAFKIIFSKSDGDWWMNSDPSITFDKQKMFNMYDSASYETYFGSKNINPYLKNDPTSLLKEHENYIYNPSMMSACIDVFSGTPVQDQTGSEAETLKQIKMLKGGR